MLGSVDTEIRTIQDVVQATIEGVRAIIQAKLAETIAKSLAAAGPAALFLGPAIAAGLNLLFNSLLSGLGVGSARASGSGGGGGQITVGGSAGSGQRVSASVTQAPATTPVETTTPVRAPAPVTVEQAAPIQASATTPAPSPTPAPPAPPAPVVEVTVQAPEPAAAAPVAPVQVVEVDSGGNAGVVASKMDQILRLFEAREFVIDDASRPRQRASVPAIQAPPSAAYVPAIPAGTGMGGAPMDTAAILAELRATREAFEGKQFTVRGTDLHTVNARVQSLYDAAGMSR
jgi:hypothetical protein